MDPELVPLVLPQVVFFAQTSFQDSSFYYKDRSLMNEGSILMTLVQNFCLICTHGSIIEYQRINPCSWISDLLSSNGCFSLCSPIWFPLKSSLIPESMVILFWCFHYPPDSLFVLTWFSWSQARIKLDVYNCHTIWVMWSKNY